MRQEMGIQNIPNKKCSSIRFLINYLLMAIITIYFLRIGLIDIAYPIIFSRFIFPQSDNFNSYQKLLANLTFGIDVSTFMTAMIFLYIFAYLGEIKNLTQTQSMLYNSERYNSNVLDESLDQFEVLSARSHKSTLTPVYNPLSSTMIDFRHSNDEASQYKQRIKTQVYQKNTKNIINSSFLTSEYNQNY
ncbi:UNKNOWN [Stylonychia lemnae]|uniref:Uncharacterized protein n=1 Tax=Stylonychia lemnae TaxID=5949 RepID=A0A078BCX9_STYLE|nr:UNKNOWN [Stylonychia lemnae]|eukprot:CDW91448.1 UNKNOWN [Stylonychia lemnae]